MKSIPCFAAIIVICMILCSCNSVHMETPMQSDIHSINDEELTPLNNEETLQFQLIGNSFNLATDYCAVVNNGFYRLTNKADGSIALLFYDFTDRSISEKKHIETSSEVTDMFITSDGNTIYTFFDKRIDNDNCLNIKVLSSAGETKAEYNVNNYVINSNSKVALYGEDLIISSVLTENNATYNILRISAATGEANTLMSAGKNEEINIVDVTDTKLCLLIISKDEKQGLLSYEIITIDMETGDRDSVMSFSSNEIQGVFSGGNLYYFKENDLLIRKLNLSAKEETLLTEEMSNIASRIGASQVVLDNNVRDDKLIIGFYDEKPLAFMAIDITLSGNAEEVPLLNEPIVAETEEFFVVLLSDVEDRVKDFVDKNGTTEEVIRVEPSFAIISKEDYWHGNGYNIFRHAYEFS